MDHEFYHGFDSSLPFFELFFSLHSMSMELLSFEHNMWTLLIHILWWSFCMKMLLFIFHWKSLENNWQIRCLLPILFHMLCYTMQTRFISTSYFGFDCRFFCSSSFSFISWPFSVIVNILLPIPYSNPLPFTFTRRYTTYYIYFLMWQYLFISHAFHVFWLHFLCHWMEKFEARTQYMDSFQFSTRDTQTFSS